MTVLNIRKNTAQLLKSAADVIENVKVPELPRQKIRDCRVVLATLIMPK